MKFSVIYARWINLITLTTIPDAYPFLIIEYCIYQVRNFMIVCKCFGLSFPQQTIHGAKVSLMLQLITEI